MSDSEEVSTSGRPEFPDPDPKGGPGSKFPLPSLMKAILDDPRGQAARFHIRDPYMLVRPEAFHTVLTPPPGCTAVYYKSMEMGLRFPLTPFVKDLLNAYNLCISQISPNSWGGIVAFQTICAMLSVRPTLTLWRNMFKLVEMSAGDNGPACSLTRLLESDPEIAEKLNYAAMRAAQLKAELKAKKIGIPKSPKDPSKPKASKKRKERDPEKVAKTAKALAKDQAEKAKKAKSIEVNSPRPEEKADKSEGTRISVHSEDFRPVRSPQYTPATPRGPHDDPEELSLALSKPFAELDVHGLDTRWTNAGECLYSPTDREYIAQTRARRRRTTCSAAGLSSPLGWSTWLGTKCTWPTRYLTWRLEVKSIMRSFALPKRARG
ncbi:uncharacterized protein LOC109136246 [Beta vulgaris subsp. vulgaris]|uniref:uncharacterized protein LOC109136246 n=1 Tax=Beta vulgaris subsp. vulgaris TaxID=3555 RepID=UPI002547E385|nr:uncharacterized protein LOC109136246 [Beta vulgaris subsp. vulgaris]